MSKDVGLLMERQSFAAGGASMTNSVAMIGSILAVIGMLHSLC